MTRHLHDGQWPFDQSLSSGQTVHDSRCKLNDSHGFFTDGLSRAVWPGLKSLFNQLGRFTGALFREIWVSERFLVLGKVLFKCFWVPRAIKLRFCSKTDVSVGFRPPCWCPSGWRLHTNLYKFGWHTSANSARIKNSRDLILGEVVYIAITYHISDSWIYLLNGYDF